MRERVGWWVVESAARPSEDIRARLEGPVASSGGLDDLFFVRLRRAKSSAPRNAHRHGPIFLVIFGRRSFANAVFVAWKLGGGGVNWKRSAGAPSVFVEGECAARRGNGGAGRG
jgi:hypothetical protein